MGEIDTGRGTGPKVTGKTADKGKEAPGREKEDSISKGKEDAAGEAMGPGRQELLTCVRSLSLTGEAKHPALPLHVL
jgi:hypothetical protein